MTTPGMDDDKVPDGAYVPGTGFGQENRHLDSVEKGKNFLHADVHGAFGGLGSQLFEVLGGILDDVLGALIQGAQAIGIAAANLWETLVDGFTGFVDGIASALGFGGDSGVDPDDFAVNSTLANIRDGQRDLIGNVDALMNDNPGFINLCMSRSVEIVWDHNHWHFCDFDTYITEHKNARVGRVSLGTWSEPLLVTTGGNTATASGIVFEAPGVWNIQSQVTMDSEDTRYRHFETEVRIYQANNVGQGSTGTLGELYSATRFASGTDNDRIQSAFISKPIIIPDDGNTYMAVHLARFQAENDWKVWGGALWTSFSAIRHSVDTTDYGAQDQPTGTDVISQ